MLHLACALLLIATVDDAVVAPSVPGSTLVDRVVAAPGPIPADVRERFGLKPFYEQCIVWEGLPFVASAKVDPRALQEAVWLARRMLRSRPEIARAMGANNVRVAIMDLGEVTTDVPEHSDLEPKGYWDMRARGLGATPHRPAVSAGEENLLTYPGDPYSTESIFIHEFAHAIHEMGLSSVDPTFDRRLGAAYDAAMKKGLWQGAYASENRMEYWAEATQSFFDTNRENDHQHNHVDTVVELKEYDPAVWELCMEVYGQPWAYTRADARAGQEHLAGWDPAASPTFAWADGVREAWRQWELLEQARAAGRKGRGKGGDDGAAPGGASQGDDGATKGLGSGSDGAPSAIPE
ncbi:MAG: hypothetical protein FJ270_09535 [Planctomycetes bacterium]|nr:hypothetical protein [Planctomycetota bacterium]